MADVTQTFMKHSGVLTPEKPERRQRQRTHSAEARTEETRSKSSTDRGKKTTVQRDRNRSPAQPDRTTYTIPSTLTDGQLSASLITAGC